MKMKQRARAQLVIHIGEGIPGERLRALFDKAASKSGKTVSAWARDILLDAVNQPSFEFRISKLETLLRGFKSP
jgi:hypothetical protein